MTDFDKPLNPSEPFKLNEFREIQDWAISQHNELFWSSLPAVVFALIGIFLFIHVWAWRATMSSREALAKTSASGASIFIAIALLVYPSWDINDGVVYPTECYNAYARDWITNRYGSSVDVNPEAFISAAEDASGRDNGHASAVRIDGTRYFADADRETRDVTIIGGATRRELPVKVASDIDYDASLRTIKEACQRHD